jgi:rsbT co-antagonist protein RsbR
MATDDREAGAASNPASNADPRAAQIHDFIDQLTAGELGARVAPSGRDDDLDRIVTRLNGLADKLSAKQEKVDARLGELMEMIIALANLDFDKSATIDGKGDLTDAVAAGLNMLSEELRSSAVSRAYIDNIIASMSDALIVMDLNGVVQSVNRAATELLEYGEEELIGGRIDMLSPPEGSAAYDPVSGGETHNRELTWVSKGGRALSVAFSASALRDSHGDATGFVCVARDITERKQVAEERSRFQEAIERQAIAIRELSTPLIPISDEVVVMPLIGVVDAGRAEQVLGTLLSGVAERRAQVVIIDITGVPVVDSHVAYAILRAAQAVRLLGAVVVLTGVRPDVATTLVTLGIDLSGVVTLGTLQSGIAFSMRHKRVHRSP